MEVPMKQKASTTNGKQLVSEPLFMPELVFVTHGIRQVVSAQEAGTALVRHTYGDWGDLYHHEWMRNDLALISGDMLVSVYHSQDGIQFWIVTEAELSATTILLPEER